MESFMLDLVFKIIIGHISVIPKSNIIFMDESISVLDKHRMASIDELFAFLRQYYETVFLITHMKQVNNHINNSIEIIP
jgi:ABC-type lipoprotein export system ATPase subunit